MTVAEELDCSRKQQITLFTADPKHKICHAFGIRINMFHSKLTEVMVRADLHGTSLSHATSLQQAYDMNCFV